jgi:hypothetical protein
MTETLKLKCAGCGAAVTGDESSCRYCGIALFDAQGKRLEPPKELKDFGWVGILPILVTLAGAIGIHLYGWTFETRSFFQDNAMICWSIILPLWILTLSISWKTESRFTFLIGLGFAAVLFVIHVFKTTALMGGYYMNDSYGAAALVAGPVFLVWMFGRIVHIAARKRLN